jgi:hypothetical protein
MIKKYICVLFLINSTLFYSQVSGVGINETIPEQALHLGSQTGTVRVDGLNATNNSYNGGEVDKTYPLYVDENGDMTLETSAYNNSNGNDAFISTDPINSELSITLAQANDGYEAIQITSYNFTVDRNTVLEIKYSLSIEVFQNSLLTKIRDPYARNITNFFTLNSPVLTPTTRRYAAHSKCYFNYNYELGAASPPNASTGYIYNSGTTYVYLTPGTHTLRFYGTVCSGTSNRATFVRFAGGPDAVFLKLH